MGTKERLAELLEKSARIIPGVGSYQDKEGLREGDKRIREALAGRLDGARKTLEKVIYRQQQDGQFQGLDRLGKLERQMQQAADEVRYAARGYSGVFDTVKIDEERLEAVVTFDISMAENVSVVEKAAKDLKGTAADDKSALTFLEDSLEAFQDAFKEREQLFQ